MGSRWDDYGEDWPAGHRPCTKCQKMKPFEAFTKHKLCAFGRSSVCKRCKSEAGKKKYREKPKEYKLWKWARERAISKYRAFDIDVEDVKIPDVCPVLGIPMDCASLDRIDSSKGYVKGNIQVVSCQANAVKGSATIEELEKVLAYMRRSMKEVIQ